MSSERRNHAFNVFFLYLNNAKLRGKIKLILTCPIDTLGMGTSETSLSTSGPPNDDTRIAFIAWKLETARGLSNSLSPKTDSARTKKLYQSLFNISKTIVRLYIFGTRALEPSILLAGWLTPVPPVTAHEEPWPFFLFWRHHFWPKLASSILNFCSRKRSFQWCPDQTDWSLRYAQKC